MSERAGSAANSRSSSRGTRSTDDDPFPLGSGFKITYEPPAVASTTSHDALLNLYRKQEEEMALMKNRITTTAIPYHPMVLSGKYHTFRMKSKYPIPGGAVEEDKRRAKALGKDAPAVHALAQAARQALDAKAPGYGLAAMHIEESEARDKVEHKHNVNLPVDPAEELAKLEEKEKQMLIVARWPSEDGMFPIGEDEKYIFDCIKKRDMQTLRKLFAVSDIAVNVMEVTSGKTALMIAASAANTEAVELYLKKGADPNKQSYTGSTALHCAYDSWLNCQPKPDVKRERLTRMCDIMGLLCQFRADPNLVTASAMTPLHLAAKYDHGNVARILLKYGARTDIRNEDGCTAEDLARKKNSRDFLAVYLNRHAIAQQREIHRIRWGDPRVFKDVAASGDPGTQGGAAALQGQSSPGGTKKPFLAGSGSLSNRGLDKDTLGELARLKGVASETVKTSLESSIPAEELIDRWRLYGGWMEMQHKKTEEALRSSSSLAPSEKLRSLTGSVPTFKIKELDLHERRLKEVDVVAAAEEVGDTEFVNRARVSQAAKNAGYGYLLGKSTYDRHSHSMTKIRKKALAAGMGDDDDKDSVGALPDREYESIEMGGEDVFKGQDPFRTKPPRAVANPHAFAAQAVLQEAGVLAPDDPEKPPVMMDEDDAGGSAVDALKAGKGAVSLTAKLRSWNEPRYITWNRLGMQRMLNEADTPAFGIGHKDYETVSPYEEAAKARLNAKDPMLRRLQQLAILDESLSIHGKDDSGGGKGAAAKGKGGKKGGGAGAAGGAGGEEEDIPEWMLDPLRDAKGVPNRFDAILAAKERKMRKVRWQRSVLNNADLVDAEVDLDGEEAEEEAKKAPVRELPYDPSKPQTMAERRKRIAFQLAQDVPNLNYSRVYTHSMEGRLYTRKPATSSAIMRAGRYRLDTKTAVTEGTGLGADTTADTSASETMKVRLESLLLGKSASALADLRRERKTLAEGGPDAKKQGIIDLY